MDLPIQAPASNPTWTPRPPGNRVLITGAAGTVASLITHKLAKSYDLVGLDAAPIESDDFVETHQADLSDTALLDRLIQEADYVVHLATGASQGKEGLYAIDVDATNRILASAITHGTRRVVLASSNHVA